MFGAIIRKSIAHRKVVIAITAIIGLIGAFSFRYLIIDAVPDITNVQVQINTEAPGYSPFEVERRITVPVEIMLAGMPALDYTRSLSRYGLSQVTAVFKDGTDIYFARQLISQQLQEAKGRLPEGVSPSMGPISTGLGEIFMFSVESAPDASPQLTLQELREINDWVVRPQLISVPGVVEVNSIGGASKQIVISPNLDRLRAYEFTLDDLTRAVALNNNNTGAGFIERNGEQLLLRVPAQVSEYGELAQIVVGVHEGIPIRVSDVARVEIGSELRAGAATDNGHEIVLGTVFMLIGENGLNVSARVSKRLVEVQRSLPAGVVVKPLYNRSELVNATIATVEKNLFEGAVLVIVVLLIALGNFRAALITALVIPLSMMITIWGMVQSKVSANLMSLGALDFGLIVDGAVILVENCVRRIREVGDRLGRPLTESERIAEIADASVEVRQATMFGEVIIMMVYLPILTLGGVEGKMYRPMAITVLMALVAAFILSLTFVPAAVASFVSKSSGDKHERLVEGLQERYRRFLGRLLTVPRLVLFSATALMAFSAFLFTRLGSEFMPALDEGDMTVHALRIPGTSLTQAIQMQFQLEDAIRKIPEVSHAFAKIGTAEIATDPMPPSVADGYVIMKPRSKWPDPRKPRQVLVAEIEEVAKRIPGNNYEFTQPIQMRFNELLAGVRSDVAVKVFGDDTEVLLAEGEKVAALVERIPGASDVKVEPVSGLPMIEVRLDRTKIARLGLQASTVQEIVSTAYAGQEVSRLYKGDRNFPIVVRLQESDRQRVESIAALPIPLPPSEGAHTHMIEPQMKHLDGQGAEKAYVPLGSIAEIVIGEGPNQISRDNGKRRVVVTANVRDRDLGSFVKEAQSVVANGVQLQPGYWLGWGGQYENLLAANQRLSIVVPLVLLGVFSLIMVTFRSFGYSLLVFTGIPFALSGGIIALWLRGISFSISAAVGIIALSGIAVLNGLVLVGFTRQLINRGVAIHDAVIEGAVARLRPVLMTALVASLGFVPMAISHGTGSEVQRPLATVVIGGVLSAGALTLIVMPVLLHVFSGDSKYMVWLRKVLRLS
jgi:cobalt-zinc-cadmium resistance protein CzcA